MKKETLEKAIALKNAIESTEKKKNALNAAEIYSITIHGLHDRNKLTVATGYSSDFSDAILTRGFENLVDKFIKELKNELQEKLDNLSNELEAL